MWIEKLKFALAMTLWPLAFLFWFYVMVVLYAGSGKISMIALFYFIVLWVIIVTSFFMTVFSPPIACKEVIDLNDQAGYCDYCEFRKPKRWHHCKRCNTCIHRMDHHCPILQICIHQGNHKFFILFLAWPIQMSAFAVIVGYEELWKTIKSSITGEKIPDNEHMMGTGVSNAIMTAFASIYLLCQQIPNLLRNQTLIEESRDNFDYDENDWYKNFKSVMGPFPRCLFPIREEWYPKQVKKD